ncbi:MAG: transglycosylase SLT domain-containing protein, partial [Gemmatimonadales bacterium]
MRRCLTGLSVFVAACGGRAVVNQQPTTRVTDSVPAASAAVAAEPPAVDGPAPAPKPVRDSVSVAAPVARPADSMHSASPTAAPDSAADAAVLDSLGDDQPAPSLPDVPIDATPTWDLNVADFARQPRVQYYLDLFTGRAHDRFQIWMQRMSRYEGFARAAFTARKLPGDFVYLALIESGYSPEAVSRARAVGIWQFMLGTGRLFGLRSDTWVDERRDPIKATDAAAHYLDDLSQRFGSHYLAAAAYNAGAGRVGRGLDRINARNSSDDDTVDVSGDEAFFTLADSRTIRDETKNYVPQLIAAAIIAKEPAKYGFDVSHDVVPFSLDSVIVDGGTGLDLIARLADTTLDALRDLNPHLLRLVTPPDGSYPVRVPTGTAEKIAAAYQALPDEARHVITAHEVKRGENVATLARHYQSTAELIRLANRSARGRRLTPGSTIYIPAASTTIPASFLREPDPPRSARTVVRTYTVRRGESIAAVARRAGVSVATLRRENSLPRNAVLHTGEH